MKGDTEDIKCYVQELKKYVDRTSQIQKMMMSYNKWISEILKYDNDEWLKNLLNKEKAVDDHQK